MMVNNGQQWTTMAKNWQKWETMRNNGQQWATMVNNGQKLAKKGKNLQKNGNNGQLWATMDWGYMSLVFILLSGFCGTLVWKGLAARRSYLVILNYCLTCLTFPIFPLFVLVVKTIGVFNPGENWKILARRCAYLEGSWESRFQLLLQLFIVFTRADRFPSAVQLATMASSVVMLAISSLNDARRQQKNVELVDDVKRAIDLFPGILVYNLSQIGCMALLTTLLRYWVFLPLTFVACALFGMLVLIHCKPRYKEMHKDATKGRIAVGMIEMNELDIVELLFWQVIWSTFTLVLTGLTITADLHPSLKMPGLLWEVSEID